jgi:hypothetical protein
MVPGSSSDVGNTPIKNLESKTLWASEIMLFPDNDIADSFLLKPTPSPKNPTGTTSGQHAWSVATGWCCMYGAADKRAQNSLVACGEGHME